MSVLLLPANVAGGRSAIRNLLRFSYAMLKRTMESLKVVETNTISYAASANERPHPAHSRNEQKLQLMQAQVLPERQTMMIGDEKL